MISINAIGLPGFSPTNPSQIPPRDENAPLDHDELRALAKKFEASFLTEMLKHTGIGEAREAFGGGPGEQAFSEFLVREYAGKISETAAIGLADRVYSALLTRADS